MYRYIAITCLLTLTSCSAHGKVREQYDDLEQRTRIVTTTLVRGSTTISPVLLLEGWTPHRDDNARLSLVMKSGTPVWVGCDRVYLDLDGDAHRMPDVVHSSGKPSDFPLGATQGIEMLSFPVSAEMLRGVVEAGEARIVACGESYPFTTANARHIEAFYRAVWL